MLLSSLLGSQIASTTGEGVGRLDDVVVRLRGGDYPLVIGLVARVGGRRVFVPVSRVAELADGRVALAKPKVDLRSFERREGEVLLRGDILGHRLIHVAEAELVKAWDVELRQTAEGWVVASLDTRRPARLLGLIHRVGGEARQDWKAFEALVGHAPSALARAQFRRVRRLKPAQIADLIEEASPKEGEEILEAVHADPELEADVFEELDPDTANRLFGERTDAEVAGVIARMRADDAADAIDELPQARRQKVLDELPAGARARVVTLLGFNPASAGGIMGVEFLAAAPDASVAEVLGRVRMASRLQPEALLTVHCVDASGRLVGTASVIRLLQAAPDQRLAEILDDDPVRVSADTDVVDVAVLMADYNLMTIPVVDGSNQMLGVITVDDILEATIPEDWRRREPPPRPEIGHPEPALNGAPRAPEPRG